jgi:hypothetical protein
MTHLDVGPLLLAQLFELVHENPLRDLRHLACSFRCSDWRV